MTIDTASNFQPRPGTRKITIGVLAGAVVALAAYGFKLGGHPLPGEVTAAAGTLITAFLAYMTTETYS